MPDKMYATLIGDARVARDDGTKDDSPLKIGELVLVEVPPNCAVYASEPRSAEDCARSWYLAGVARVEGPNAFRSHSRAVQLEEDFQRLWTEHGITGRRI